MTLKYKTTQDFISMLDYLTIIHKDMKKTMGRKSKSRKWAVWLLLGSSIALTKKSLEDINNGSYGIYVAIYTRLGSEIKDQIAFFSTEETDNTVIQEWFVKDLDFKNFIQGNGIKSQYSRYKKGLNTYSEQTNGILSLFIHPSYQLIDGMFSYEAKAHSLDGYSTNTHHDKNDTVFFHQFGLSWVNMLLDFTIDSFYVSSKLFQYDLTRSSLLSMSFTPLNSYSQK